MATISFMHLATAGKSKATDAIIANIRKYYPKSYYFLASDDLTDVVLIDAKI